VLKIAHSIGLTWPMIGGLVALHFIATVFEGIGLTILLPVFQLLQSGEAAAQLAAGSRWWAYLVEFYGWFGLTVTVPLLLATSFVAILTRQVLVYFRLVYSAYIKFTVIRDIRDRAFRAFLRAQLGYGEKEGLGRIVNDLTTEATVAVEAAMTSISLISMSVLALVYFSILLALSIEMTVAALVVILIAVAPVIRFIKRGQAVGVLTVEANSALLNFLTQRLRSARLVRLSGMEAAEYENMRAHTAEQYKQVMTANVLRARTTAMIEPVVAAAAFVFLYFGVTTFKLSLEQIGLFLVIIIRLIPVVKELANVRYSMASQFGSIARVLDRLASLESMRETDRGGRSDLTLDKALRLRDVAFSYDDASGYALHGVDLTIPAKTVTAIVGPSGSGKSTLIDLLPRLRVPARGEIDFDGVPVGDFTLDAVRQAVSYAPQSPQIFNVSAREHIHYGQPNADQAAIERAAKLAGAHDFIMRLPEGYDTILSEAGGRLSGGQRQRLDLARAILKPAKLLILDEPTSQLDADAETEFRDAIRRIKGETDLTIIIVGHRFSTMTVADQIAVLKEGRVVDIGTHDQLMSRGGWYADAFEKQTAWGAAPPPQAGREPVASLG
jgi:ABC-type multidrug transport system fused ATPase/permease subunit